MFAQVEREKTGMFLNVFTVVFEVEARPPTSESN